MGLRGRNESASYREQVCAKIWGRDGEKRKRVSAGEGGTQLGAGRSRQNPEEELSDRLYSLDQKGTYGYPSKNDGGQKWMESQPVKSEGAEPRPRLDTEGGQESRRRWGQHLDWAAEGRGCAVSPSPGPPPVSAH